MPYEYRREPLTPDEANRLANACQTHEEKLVVWTLLDTGLRVSELANLRKDSLDWQNHRLMVYSKEDRMAALQASSDPALGPRATAPRGAFCYL